MFGGFMKFICYFFCLMVLFFGHTNIVAQETASPTEVVQKVKEAAAYLSEKGDAGLSEFMDIKGRWVWKDTYVWVLHCEKGTNAAHPIKPKLVGSNLMGIRDTNGKLFFAEFCNMAKNPKGGWVEYMWPKVDDTKPFRKVTFVLSVPNTPYQVGAGIYDDKITINELNKLIEN